jgi:hypothetical protein
MDGFNRLSGYPYVLGWLSTPTCAVGLDRCSNLASPTIAVSKDFADLVWIGAAFPLDKDNDQIIVTLSWGSEAGFGWRRISDKVPGRKFMPWICTAGNHLFATWYDRRPSNGVAADNSLTDLYLARMDFVFGGPKLWTNINISESPDSHCSSGWPRGTRDETAAKGCTQPQTYGLCLNSATPPASSGNCQPDATPSPCPTGTTCTRVNNGIPKYGDYNGLACAPGFAFPAWETQTPPVAGGAAGVWVRAYKTDTSHPVFDKWGNIDATTKWWKAIQP